jgi:V-type H+-transporting ATPase subunit H
LSVVVSLRLTLQLVRPAGSPNDPEGQDVAVQCLESVLRVAKARELSWDSDEGDAKGPKVIEGCVPRRSRLRRVPTHRSRPQTCPAAARKPVPADAVPARLLLLASLIRPDHRRADQRVRAHLSRATTGLFKLTLDSCSRYNVVPLLLELAKQAIKEKIVRIVVSTFRNLIAKAPKQNLAAMLTAKVLPWLKTLQGRKFGDEDIKEDVDFLVDELKKSFEGLTCVRFLRSRDVP